MSDADFRAEVDMFGQKSSRGAFIVNLVLAGCAAYRTQLFLYLKACGREELGTMNLWAGMDAPPPRSEAEHNPRMQTLGSPAPGRCGRRRDGCRRA
jgi:hypothetical protein